MEDLVGQLGRTLKGAPVVVTGHRGFKGAWMSALLHRLGAEVHGVGLGPPTEPNAYSVVDPSVFASDTAIDICNAEELRDHLVALEPALVVHLAAQALVSVSYDDPVGTFATNALGTVHVLDAVRAAGPAVALVVATTDKVYENLALERGYHEADRLGGTDMYAASKAAAELAVAAWRRSFRHDGLTAPIATARGGNVIGGGDYAHDRLVPDIVRATHGGTRLVLRNPAALRPWQHVLDCLFGYALLGAALVRQDVDVIEAGAFNFGPRDDQRRTVGDLVDAWTSRWPVAQVEVESTPRFAEHGLLWITSERAERMLGWRPQWDFETTLDRTVDWYRTRALDGDVAAGALVTAQIDDYLQTAAGGSGSGPGA